MTRDRSRSEVFGERIETLVLDGGMPFFCVPKKGWRKSYAMIGIDFGSIDEDFTSGVNGRRNRVPAGVAHFLEHKMFEKADGDVSDRFAALGCSTNAMTGFSHTGYLFEGTDHVEEAFEILIDFVTRPYFTPALVEKEKGIIAEEIKMYDDDPGWRAFMSVMQGLYAGHPLATDIAGTVESIGKITADHLELCHAAFYQPRNMHVAAAGDVDPDRLAAIADRVVARNRPGSSPRLERHLKAPRRKPVRRHHDLAMPVASGKLHLGYRLDAELAGVDPLDLEIALDAFLGAILGKSGTLYQELFHEGLLDDSFGFSLYSEKDYAFVVLSSESRDPARLDQRLAAGIATALESTPKPADLRRQRRKLHGDFVRSFDSVSSLCWNLIECHGKGADFHGYADRIAAMTDRRVLEIARAVLAPQQISSCRLLPGERVQRA